MTNIVDFGLRHDVAAKRDCNARLVLEVRHLQLVQSIVREGNVARAAPSLNLSPSALSHQLLNVEHDLGVKLFERVGKRMVLTTAGAAVLDASDEILHRLAQAERDARASISDRSTVRIAAGCPIINGSRVHWRASRRSRQTLTSTSGCKERAAKSRR
ncbi:LysR family transcriptional regulator [Variovorax sp. J2P1-59]|uniref:LysR family transcriptional regulator n=1 Tax=Variovorax flavidus TaxID=3053501 RepID=UPI002576741F|nr:LysR family transcriptional regulator [Variovorax sp. J2P1-59]MDM0078149.1 LysR family transcriptional regulator [Variovorax sp. J2P1-59]